ncbi:Response regulator receiver domain-containing protein [Roseateles sp. YR242]|uniref:response regulator n=1 Tax=Roseateles sp. YR242 TaxID=1855305 RepID=UPI0008AF7331|nr:response regulator [Roseateles sp. YR242]SEL38953.1 Response regulator receiver domain-containing protein [Roseateles sp. YR242]
MKVVLIEDCAMLRRLMVCRLQQEPGITVVGQADCESAAVATVALNHPDVVLVDLSITAGTGLSAISRIRQGGFRGKIYVLSAEDRYVFGPQVMSRGADAFYDKAFDFERLIEDLGALSHQGWLAAA